MMKKKRLWAWFMAAVMAIGLLPVTALADDAAGETATTNPEASITKDLVKTEQDEPIQITKKLESNGDGTYTITMEAYATDKVTTTTTSKPMDIVLVLDVSGSMDDPVSFLDSTHKIVVLKSAVKNFIDKVAKDATDNDAEHRISIVKFAGNKTEEPGDEQYNNGYVYNYSQIVKNLTDVKEDKDTLKTAVDGLRPAGSTRADYGLELAQTVLADKNDDTRGKVIIMFTDGEPNHSNGFDSTVAKDAIDIAGTLKKTGTTIFTIGMFGEDIPDDTDQKFWQNKGSQGNDKRKHQYMYAVSSRYPNATTSTKGGWKVNPGNRVDGQFYFTANSADELENVFSRISDNIHTATVTADTTSILKDTLTNHFKFVGNVTDDVTVTKVPVAGKDAEGNYTWDTENAVDMKEVSDRVNLAIGYGSITVSNFDYSANAVTETTDEDENITYTGSKLVLTFKIRLNPDADWTLGENEYETNDTDSNKAGLYGAEDKSGEDYNQLLNESPKISVKAYGVTYKENGGDENTAPTDSKGYLINTKATVKDKENLKRDGYTFKGWSENPNALPTASDLIKPGDEISVDGNKTLYAIWEKGAAEEVTLIYNPNGGSGLMLPEAYEEGATVTVKACGYTYNGFDFVSWSTDKDADPNDPEVVKTLKQSGDTFQINETTTLYAIWKIKTTRTSVTLTYNANGGIGNDVTEEHTTGDTVTVKIVGECNFTRNGYTFVGWSENKDAASNDPTLIKPVPAYTFEIQKDTTLYAIWKQDEITPTGDVTITKELVGIDNTPKQDIYKNGDLVVFKIAVTNGTSETKKTLELTENPGEGFKAPTFWRVKTSPDQTVPKTDVGKEYSVPVCDAEGKTIYAVELNADGTVKISNLVAGETAELYYFTYVNIREPYNKDDYKNIAVVGDKESEPVYVPVTGIDIMKEVIGNTTVKRGDWVLYKIVMKNIGEFDLTGIKITETPDAKLVDGYFCDKDGKELTGNNVNGNEYTIASLAKDATETLYYTAEVSNNAANGEKLGNHVVAEATCGKDGKVNDAFDSDKVTVNVPGNNSSGGGSHRRHTSTKVEEVLNKEDHFQYVQGYPDATVRPDANITRAEATVIFFRLLTDSVREKYLDTENSFTDVNAVDWYNIGISTMENGGFVNGYKDGSFRPNGYITRAELATIISNFDDLEPVEESKFPDAAEHWAEAYINSAAEKGWLSGYADGLFRPNQLITRAETMSMINRVLERSVDADGLHQDAKQWQDNPIGKWYYYAVLEATNPHEYERKDTADVERWTAITAEKIWEN